MKAKIGILLSTVFIVFFGSTLQSSAETSRIPFEVKPKFTSDQEKDVTNYISVKTKDTKKKETFEFSVKNNSNETRKISMKVVNAYTSPNGVVQYTDSETENSTIVDENYKMSNHLSLNGEKTIELKSGESKIVKANFEANNINGTLLGGVAFQLNDENENVSKDDSSFKIKNKINVVLGVMVKFKDNQEVNFELDNPYVDPMPAYYAIRLPITLNSPELKKVKIEYEVSKDSSILFTGNSEYDFSPMSKVKAVLPWDADSIKTNENYKLTGKLTYKLNGEEKIEPFEFNFTYKSNDGFIENLANKIKRPFEENPGFAWIILLPIIGLIGLIFFFRRKNKE